MNMMMSLLSNSGYIVVNKEIIKKLGLNEAIMLGELCSEYSYWEKFQKLDDGYFFSTRENIEENTGMSAYLQRESLKKLVNVGIVLEKLKGMPQQKWYSFDMERLYEVIMDDEALTASSKNILHQGVKNFNTKESKILTPSSKEILQHDVKNFETNNNNNNNKKNNNKDYMKKVKFKDKIYLSQREYEDLITKFGKEITDNTITRLDLYKKSTGKSYNDDYATLILWIDNDLKQEKKLIKNDFKKNEDNIWYKELKEKFGEDLSGLYANNFEATNY